MNFVKLLSTLTITLLCSCSSTREVVKYELVKIDHGEVFDVVFRITNNTEKTLRLDEPQEGICATLVREWKYVKGVESEWERIHFGLGTAIAPPTFKVEPGQSKEFMLISAWNKKDLAKRIENEKLKKALFRVWYTSTDEKGIYTNAVELK